MLEKYAVEIELDKDVKGVIHISELDWSFVSIIANICPIGSKIKVKLLCMDSGRSKIFG